MKVVAMYLPQFHNVEENNLWWGEGYTDWTAARQAEALFANHYQPRIPLNNNYYDLLRKETMEWQAELMKKYGVDGVCFYHYWFKDGKKLLEKPAENLLEWTDIDMPFCFSWANNAWVRSWSKIKGNPWASKFEVQSRAVQNGVLMEQDYGKEEQWRSHFNYLLPFFYDKRYIRLENKPIFIFCSPSRILCLKDMVEKWNSWAKDAGLEGIYFIGTNCDAYDKEIVDAALCQEPTFLLGRVPTSRSTDEEPCRVNYDDAWEYLLNYKDNTRKIYYGGFVTYDDTPRRGKDGITIYNETPEKFKNYFMELLAKNYVEDNEFVFLNAWNEWGEGMYLEPDEKYEYGYLEAVQYAKENYYAYIDKYKNKQSEQFVWKEYSRLEQINARYSGYWKILDKWLALKEEGVSLAGYFERNGIHTIAIYGMGMLGKHLLKELAHSSVEVKYGIDKSASKISADCALISSDAHMEPVDAVVITVISEFRKITDILIKKGLRNFISLEDVITQQAGITEK